MKFSRTKPLLRPPRAARKQQAFRPRVELLETRLAPSIGLSLGPTTQSSVKLLFDGHINDHYTLERGTDASNLAPVADNISWTTPYYIDSGLASGAYLYQVVGTNQDGSTDQSGILAVTVGGSVGISHPDFSNIYDLTPIGATAFSPNPNSAL